MEWWSSYFHFFVLIDNTIRLFFQTIFMESHLKLSFKTAPQTKKLRKATKNFADRGKVVTELIISLDFKIFVVMCIKILTIYIYIYKHLCSATVLSEDCTSMKL